MSTIYSDIQLQQATFFSAWLGVENIFNYASSGGTSTPILSSNSFSAELDSLLTTLTSNGAKGVIANIPDFRDFPYYTLVAWNNAAMTQPQADSLNDIYTTAGMPQINFHAGNNGFIIQDNTAPNGYRQLHQGEYITLSVPLDSMKCNRYGLLAKVIDNRYALDSNEVAQIDQAINSYNSIIAQNVVFFFVFKSCLYMVEFDVVLCYFLSCYSWFSCLNYRFYKNLRMTLYKWLLFVILSRLKNIYCKFECFPKAFANFIIF